MHAATLKGSGAEERLSLEATTRAGLVRALVKGIAEASSPVFSDGIKPVQCAFSVEADSFSDVLQQLADRALEYGQKQGEVYEDATLSLITATKLVGAFIGRAAEADRPKFVEIVEDPVRREDGCWIVDFMVGRG